MKSFLLTIYSDYEFHEKCGLKTALQKRFPVIDQYYFQPIELPLSCWNTKRHQYNANCILCWIQSKIKTSLFLILTDKNLYSPGLRYVFGIGLYHKGAITSSYHLNNDINFLIKEVTHELGHVFGLPHCSLPCVMTFSNSVFEAYQKNDVFCSQCTNQIHNSVKKLH
ncbi:MAG: hypothetical protein ACFFAU_06555 [Candidatus Hodarchaeota archaeon]